MRSAVKMFYSLPFCLAIHSPCQSKPPVLIDTAPLPSAHFPARWYPVASDTAYTVNIEKKAPYTATLVTATHFVDPSTKQARTFSTSNFQARDSAGRKREETERPRPDGHGGTIMAREVTVTDPVSHCTFRWMEPWVAPGMPTAGVTCLPRTLHYINQNIWADSIVTEPKEVRQLDAVFLSEPLGKRNFGDVQAEGVRNTKTISNPRPGESNKFVTEIWYSPDMKELIEMKEVRDPKHDQSSIIPHVELTNIRRTDPDPALFYPPAGYDIRPTTNPPQ